MIAVDTSALMAVVLGEDKAEACIAALAEEDEILISAVTVAEALIVSARRNVGDEMENLIQGLGLNIIDVSLRLREEPHEPTRSGARAFTPPA